MRHAHILSFFLAIALALILITPGCAQKESAPSSSQPPNQQSQTTQPPAQQPTQQTPTPAQPAPPAPVQYPTTTREGGIPAAAKKYLPADDIYPPILNSSEWAAPVPMEGPINSAGAEDSPFITPDGNDFYFFFTPDVSVPVEKQLLDNLTGVWHSGKSGNTWSEPERVWLIEPGNLSLDGCEFVSGGVIWVCSARAGYTGIHWFTAEYPEGKWQGWKNADFRKEYEVGELHFSADGGELYFHSGRPGGKGQYDVWVSRNVSGQWQEPENVAVVNTEDSEGWPYLSQGGSELWFTRFYQGSPAIFRSKRENGSWSAPELIISQFAGEPTLDNEGNLYFTHHYYSANGTMLEADIYVAKKK